MDTRKAFIVNEVVPFCQLLKSIALRLPFKVVLLFCIDRHGNRPSVSTIGRAILELPVYTDIVRFLIHGQRGLIELSRNRQRSIIKRAMRYRITESDLRYLEREGKLSYCVLKSEVQTVLDWAHDGHGHFATSITIRNLHGRYWWPSRYSDIVRRCHECYICAETGSRLPFKSGTLRVVAMNP